MPLENTLPVASMQSIVQMPLTFGSLFAGIGGLDLGFERAGMVCKWQVEIDKYAQRVLAKHWPTVRRWDDVRTWPQPDTEYVDCIVGGFPCQDISYAGKGAGLQGERSGLFFEVCRIVGQMEPRFIVLENVAALLTRGLGDVLGSLASLGYDAEWNCIPAASIGAPHIRDRLFIIAVKSGPWSSVFPNANDSQGPRFGRDSGEVLQVEETIRSCSCGSPLADANGKRRNKRRKDQTDNERDESGSSCECTRSNTDSQRLEKWQGQNASGAWPESRAQLERSQWWESEPAVGRVANGVPKRVDRLRGLGNAVVPQVAEYVARRLLASFHKGI